MNLCCLHCTSCDKFLRQKYIASRLHSLITPLKLDSSALSPIYFEVFWNILCFHITQSLSCLTVPVPISILSNLSFLPNFHLVFTNQPSYHVFWKMPKLVSLCWVFHLYFCIYWLISIKTLQTFFINYQLVCLPIFEYKLFEDYMSFLWLAQVKIA